MQKSLKEFIWSQKHRPNNIKQCVLPTGIKVQLQSYVDEGDIQNLIFTGGAGIGKTTAALAIVNELDADFLFLNGSGDDRGIDTVRDKIQTFASSMSLENKRRIVIYDEADNLTHDAQLALRSVIEKFSSNCSFILTGNYKNRLIDALLSRCFELDFTIPANEKKPLMIEMIKRTAYILKKEGVNFQKEVLISLVKKTFPDFRKTINTLQSYAKSSENGIDTGVLGCIRDDEIDTLKVILKSKDYDAIYKWVMTEVSDPLSVILKMYENLTDFFENDATNLAQAIIYLHEGQFESATSADHKLCLLSTLAKLMVDCKVK